MHYFWSLNPKQFNKHIFSFNRKTKDEAKDKDRFNYMLGQYMSYAFNSPKQYPKNPFMESIQEQEELKEMTADEMEKMARINTIKKGGQVKWN